MKNIIRIKTYIKDQIQKGIISKKDLMKLQTRHLLKVSELKDIDRKTIDETLLSVKSTVNPDIINREIRKLMLNKENPLAGQIKDIMDGRT